MQAHGIACKVMVLLGTLGNLGYPWATLGNLKQCFKLSLKLYLRNVPYRDDILTPWAPVGAKKVPRIILQSGILSGSWK